MNDYLISGLAHIGIMTDHAQECADFYVKYLGFRPYYSYVTENVSLIFVENGGCVLEFVQSDEEFATGMVNHIALEVQGIEALVAHLRTEGIEFETEELNLMPDFFPNGVRNIFIKGPAGERIELFDYSR